MQNNELNLLHEKNFSNYHEFNINLNDCGNSQNKGGNYKSILKNPNLTPISNNNQNDSTDNTSVSTNPTPKDFKNQNIKQFSPVINSKKPNPKRFDVDLSHSYPSKSSMNHSKDNTQDFWNQVNTNILSVNFDKRPKSTKKKQVSFDMNEPVVFKTFYKSNQEIDEKNENNMSSKDQKSQPKNFQVKLNHKDKIQLHLAEKTSKIKIIKKKLKPIKTKKLSIGSDPLIISSNILPSSYDQNLAQRSRGQSADVRVSSYSKNEKKDLSQKPNMSFNYELLRKEVYMQKIQEAGSHDEEFSPIRNATKNELAQDKNNRQTPIKGASSFQKMVDQTEHSSWQKTGILSTDATKKNYNEDESSFDQENNCVVKTDKARKSLARKYLSRSVDAKNEKKYMDLYQNKKEIIMNTIKDIQAIQKRINGKILPKITQQAQLQNNNGIQEENKESYSRKIVQQRNIIKLPIIKKINQPKN